MAFAQAYANKKDPDPVRQMARRLVDEGGGVFDAKIAGVLDGVRAEVVATVRYPDETLARSAFWYIAHGIVTKVPSSEMVTAAKRVSQIDSILNVSIKNRIEAAVLDLRDSVKPRVVTAAAKEASVSLTASPTRGKLAKLQTFAIPAFGKHGGKGAVRLYAHEVMAFRPIKACDYEALGISAPVNASGADAKLDRGVLVIGRRNKDNQIVAAGYAIVPFGPQDYLVEGSKGSHNETVVALNQLMEATNRRGFSNEYITVHDLQSLHAVEVGPAPAVFGAVRGLRVVQGEFTLTSAQIAAQVAQMNAERGAAVIQRAVEKAASSGAVVLEFSRPPSAAPRPADGQTLTGQLVALRP